ncbi:unnamed protein product, partial [Iphiclides podalirius]
MTIPLIVRADAGIARARIEMYAKRLADDVASERKRASVAAAIHTPDRVPNDKFALGLSQHGAPHRSGRVTRTQLPPPPPPSLVSPSLCPHPRRDFRTEPRSADRTSPQLLPSRLLLCAALCRAAELRGRLVFPSGIRGAVAAQRAIRSRVANAQGPICASKGRGEANGGPALSRDNEPSPVRHLRPTGRETPRQREMNGEPARNRSELARTSSGLGFPWTGERSGCRATTAAQILDFGNKLHLSRDKLSPAFCIASINCTTLGADCHATTTLMIGEAEEKSASSRPEASAAYHHGPLRRSDAVMSRNYFQATA